MVATYEVCNNDSQYCATGEWVCPVLQPPLNGTVAVTGREAGDIAVYECQSGLMLVGSSQRVCQSDRGWSGEEPQCVQFLCPNLTDPVNGTVSLSGNTPGSLACYSCQNGTVCRTCLMEGVWSGTEVSCGKHFAVC